MIKTVLGYFEKPHFHAKTPLATFLGNFWKNWATFYSNIWSHWSQQPTHLRSAGSTLIPGFLAPDFQPG